MMSYSRFFMKCLEVTLFVLLTIVILLVLIQVLSRYAIQLPFVGIEELSRLFFVWACSMGAAYGVIREKHINVEILDKILPPKAGRFFHLICAMVILCITGVMVTYGTWFVMEGWTYPDYTTALFYPRSLFHLPVPISGAIMFIYTANKVFLLLKSIFTTSTS